MGYVTIAGIASVGEVPDRSPPIASVELGSCQGFLGYPAAQQCNELLCTEQNSTSHGLQNASVPGNVVSSPRAEKCWKVCLRMFCTSCSAN